MWDGLKPREQARVLHLLIDHIDYDGEAGEIAITFHPTGISSLAHEVKASTKPPAENIAEAQRKAS